LGKKLARPSSSFRKPELKNRRERKYVVFGVRLRMALVIEKRGGLKRFRIERRLQGIRYERGGHGDSFALEGKGPNKEINWEGTRL